MAPKWSQKFSVDGRSIFRFFVDFGFFRALQASRGRMRVRRACEEGEKEVKEVKIDEFFKMSPN